MVFDLNRFKESVNNNNIVDENNSFLYVFEDGYKED